jgi:hypothetical protein
MPLILTQNRKMFITITTTVLLLFSITMLVFQDHDDVSFKTKASVINAGSIDGGH